MIALNGQVVAVRDISSPRGVLKIETHSLASLEFIEVMSDRGLTLLTLPLLHRPPQAPPTISEDVELSQGRRISLLLSFTADGAVIEVTYEEPAFIEERSKSAALAVTPAKKASPKSVDPHDTAGKTSSSREDAQLPAGLPIFCAGG